MKNLLKTAFAGQTNVTGFGGFKNGRVVVYLDHLGDATLEASLTDLAEKAGCTYPVIFEKE